MPAEELLYPAIFHQGTGYFLERANNLTASYFGGPSGGSLTGVSHGPGRIHHIATINGDCFEPLWHVVGGCTLRLLYGIRFDGCQMKYRNSLSSTEITQMSPTASSDNLPYPDYPAYLPYSPLKLRQSTKCNLEDFCKFAAQPLKTTPSEALEAIS